MQDVFIEYMVVRRKTLKTVLLKALIALGLITLILALFVLSFSLGDFAFIVMVLVVIAAYSAYFLFTSMNLEFEYSITNGEMDVDKIIAQRKRRRLASVKIRDVEAFGKYKPDEHADKTYENKIFACDCPRNPDLWYLVARTPQKQGKLFLVFNANEKMLDAIKKFLPKPILHEAFKRV
jgi:hypothetical protein